MRTFTRRENMAASLVFALGMMTLAGPMPAIAQDACAGFDRQHTITKLGGSNALAPGGLQTRAEFREYFISHSDEVRAIFARQGLDAEVADALVAAVRDDKAIRERNMPEGERVQWMAYRKDHELLTIENICLNLPGTAPAFEIAVPVVTATQTATADCTLEITTDCQPGGTSSFAVRTAPGAQVTLEDPTGSRTIIEGREVTWTGPMESPYDADASFIVSNEATTSETVTTYRFLVPRECMNLSFLGTSDEQRAGAPVSCTERLAQPVCPVPPPPNCVINLDHDELHRGEVVHYEVTGDWNELDLELTHDGTSLAEPVLATKSGSFVVSQRGSFTLTGTVTDALGQTSRCQASVDVPGTDWIVRPFGAFLLVGDEQTCGTVRQTSGTVGPAKSCPCPAGTAFGYDNGYGLGVSLERLLSQRIGLELRGLYARLDDEFWIGANGVAITDNGSADHWDLSLGLNVHLIPDHALDWYAGPFVGYSDVDGHQSLAVDRSLEHDAKGGVSWGVQTGLDWPFGASPWSLHLGARYTWIDVDVIQRYTNPAGAVTEQSQSLDIDPITVELGVAYHF